MRTKTEPNSFRRRTTGSLTAKLIEAIGVLYASVISERTEGGGITLDGDVVFDGIMTGQRLKLETKTDNYTVTSADFGKILAIATDGKTFTLPAVSSANAGALITFVNTGADGAVILTVKPNASDAIYGALASNTGGNADASTTDTLVSRSGGVDAKEWRNTKTTAKQGDYCQLMSDGEDGWWIVSGLGTWVSEG